MKGDVFQSDLRVKFAKCICTSCKRKGCELGLDSLSSHSLIIIDADKYKECGNFRGRLCDYILFYLEGSLTTAVVELKNGLVKAKEAQKQIENGSKIAQKIIGPQPVSNFLPILLHGKRMPYLYIKILKRAKVPFQGEDHRIIIERCGSQLKEILRKKPVS